MTIFVFDSRLPLFKPWKLCVLLGFVTPDLVDLGGSEKGKDGWQHRRPIILGGDEILGYVDYGGESQRGWSRWDMSGAGCSWIQRWDLLAQSLPSIGGELRRVDVALDFFDGEVSHEDVLSAYARGLFKKPHVGRSPKLKRLKRLALLMAGLSTLARTSSRFIRCYEKGWELRQSKGSRRLQNGL